MQKIALNPITKKFILQIIQQDKIIPYPTNLLLHTAID